MLTNQPIARSTDPQSSHAAAREITASGLRDTQAADTLNAVKQHPGSTSRELAHYTPHDRYVTARRLPELETAGLVFKGAIRLCREGNRPAVTWYAVNEDATLFARTSTSPR